MEFFATCNVGLEFVVAAEVCEKLPGAEVAPCSASHGGKCFFRSTVPVEELVKRLVSPEQIYALVQRIDEGLPYSSDALQQLHAAATAAPQDAWDAAVSTWHRALGSGGCNGASVTPTFCVRACRRERRKKHEYNRHQVEVSVGAAIHERFGWQVALKSPELDVYVDVYDDTAVVGIGLLAEATFKATRRLELASGVGSTPMRRSTCYAMLYMLGLQPGQICIDCMCGSGSLPLEGAANFGAAVHIASDIAKQDVLKARANALRQERSIDIGVFDACRLPFRPGSVDAVAVDLPFGRRHGSHRQNQSLYPRALRECARVVRANGKAVMLSMDKAVMRHAISNNKRFWTKLADYQIIVGGGVNSSRHGLNATLFVLERTQIGLREYSNRSSKRVRSGTPLVGAKKQGTEAKKKAAAMAKAAATPAMQAEELHKAGNYEESISAWRHLLAVGDKEVARSICYLKIAVGNMRLKRLNDALLEIDNAIACFRNEAAEERSNKAATKFRRDHAVTYSCRGQILWALGDLESAVVSFEKALSVDGSCGAAQHKLQECAKRIAAGATGDDRTRGALPQ